MRHLNLNEAVSVYITGEMNGSGEKFKLQVCGELLKCLVELENRFLDTTLTTSADNILESIVDELCDSEVVSVHTFKITVLATRKTQVYIKCIKPEIEIVLV